MEMAQAFRHLGADEVTVVEKAGALLAERGALRRRAGRRRPASRRITVIVGVGIAEVRRAGGRRAGDGVLDDGREIEADEILVRGGPPRQHRRSRPGPLGLDGSGPLEVDDQLRVQGVDGGWLYAVGDVNGRALLTHMGKYQARIAADVILGKTAEAWADHRAVPRVTFTDPQVAAVGLTERQARESSTTSAS